MGHKRLSLCLYVLVLVIHFCSIKNVKWCSSCIKTVVSALFLFLFSFLKENNQVLGKLVGRLSIRRI